MSSKSKSRFFDLLDSFLNEYLPTAKGASKNTITSYKYTFRLLLVYLFQTLQVISDKVTFDILTLERLTGFLDWLEKDRGCTASTRNQRLSALISFSAYASNRDFDAACVFRRDVVKIPFKKAAKGIRTIFTAEELDIFLHLPNMRSKTGKRDRMVLSLMYASGARAQEICDLKVKDLNLSKNTPTVTLTGKGNKRRSVSIPPSCAALLNKFLDYRNIKGQKDCYVFSSQVHEHMTVACVEEIFKKYIKLAKKSHPDLFNGASYTPHTMRHTTATHMLESGVSIFIIKETLGHSSVVTTQIYADMSEGVRNKYLKDWNQKWFGDKVVNDAPDESDPGMSLPSFLSVR